MTRHALEEAALQCIVERTPRLVLVARLYVGLQGLGDLGKHKSRLEKEKEAAAAARKSGSGSSSPVPKKLPSYKRPTSASKAMQVPKVDPCSQHACLDGTVVIV